MVIRMALARPRGVGALRHALLHQHQQHHHAIVLGHEGLHTFLKYFLAYIWMLSHFPGILTALFA